MFQEEGEAEKPKRGAEETTGGGGTAGRRAGEERGATPCWPEPKRLEMKQEPKSQMRTLKKQEGVKQQQVDQGVRRRRENRSRLTGPHVV